MAKITFRHKDFNGKVDKIQVIHTEKGQKLHKKLKILKILLGISILGNIFAVYLLKY